MTFIHKLMVMHGNGINGLRQFWALILISFFGLQVVMAVEVTYVGKEVGDGSSSYVVQNWSLTSVGKRFNTPSGQERYGTAGYYQIRPTLKTSPSNVEEGTSQGNDLGQAAGTEPTLSSPPLFLSSISGWAGTFVNLGGYSNYLGSDGSTEYRQGGLSVSVGNGPHDSPAGTGASYFGEVLQFTLGASAKFRIGLAVDSVADGNYAPNYVGIYNASKGTVFSTALTRDGNPDMVFFDIEGNAGDSFTVGLWQNTGSQSVAVLSLVTFDHQTLPVITYVGKEVSNESSSYVVQNWSAASVAKQFNISGAERYGTAGYYQIRPTLKTSPSNVEEGTSQGNDLGQAAGTEPTLSSPPSFLSSITGRAGTFVNFGGYSNYLGSDGSTEYRQGGLSVSVGNGPYDSPAGAGASYFGEVLQFTLDERAKFRIGLAVDSVADGNYAPNYVGIYNTSTGSVFSAALTRDGNPDMVFFDIEGNAGDSFTVGLWQNTGGQSVAVLSLVTFDVSQVPTDIILSASSIAENNLENAVVGSFSTTDPDSSDAHSYSLVAGAGDSDNASFNISENSFRANGTLDYESKSSYSVRVRSTDLGGNTFEKVFVVSVTDVNETPSDTTRPVIELEGATSVSVAWGGSYNDSGASVLDNVDASRTIFGIGSVNTSKPGVYTITFDATDAAGNAATQVVRTVTVSAPSSTTGADGLSDLMRYALGGNAPGDSVAKPSSSVAGEYLVITAIVRTDNPNKLTVVGEAVTDLDHYASGTSVVEVQGVDADDQDGVPDGCMRMTFSVAIEESVTKKFLRLKASLAQ
jgi:hypothetical protein